MAFEALGGVFDFEIATRVIDKYLEESQPIRELPIRDLMHLSAADAALVPALIEPETFKLPLKERVVVGERDAKLAVMATDCNPLGTWTHPPSILDAGLLAADISKFALLAPVSVPGGIDYLLDSLGEPARLVDIIRKLEHEYQGAHATIDRALGYSGLVRLRGLLWVARLGVLRHADSVESDLRTAMQSLEIEPPASAPTVSAGPA